MGTRRIVVLLATVALILCISASGFAGKIQNQLVEESTVDQVLRRGVLRVGISTFVPWAMKDKTGKLVGFEIDVARRLAKDMGVKVQFMPTKWAGIIPALLTGKFDVIIGGMGILPKRNLKVNFSMPYDETGLSIAANKAKAGGFKTLSDFNRPGVVISARLGGTGVAAARKFLPQAELRQFDDESQVIQEVVNGRAHALVTSAPLPAFLAIKYPSKLFLPIKGTFTREPIGFAIRKSDFDTLNFLNNWITVVKAEGWLKERKHYWFETRDWEGLLK